jgi:hypothetical protein
MKRKGLFWLTVLEVSAMINWPLCSWACGEAAHQGGEPMMEQFLTSWWPGSGIESKTVGLESQYPPQRAYPLRTRSLPTRPHILKLHYFPILTWAGTSL